VARQLGYHGNSSQGNYIPVLLVIRSGPGPGGPSPSFRAEVSHGVSVRGLGQVHSWVLDRGYADFYEKALFVKPTWRLLAVAECNGFRMPFARYASIRTVSESTLFGGSVHRMRSVLARATKRCCNLPSGLYS
jgi:hypothetical protein